MYVCTYIHSSPLVIFDPASFYGHSEFDLSIAAMFGGFSNAFYNTYHQLIPKAPGFDKKEPTLPAVSLSQVTGNLLVILFVMIHCLIIGIILDLDTSHSH